MTLSMEPQGDETLHGVATTTVTTNECGGRGTVFEDPFVATRVGDVPSSVTVADPTTGHIPMSANPTPPGPGLVLEGTYRLDLDFQSQTINGSPVTKALPNRSEWWAFRSACDATGCVAAGVRLVDDNPNQSTGIATALDFRDGRWQETTSTLQPAEQCPNGPDADVSTVSWSLVPQPDGALRGVGHPHGPHRPVRQARQRVQGTNRWRANGRCPGHRGHRRPDAASHAPLARPRTPDVS